ncbi:MAG: hypothetical protein QW567_03245 [Candidatus Hadarchaeales archaeon]
MNERGFMPMSVAALIMLAMAIIFSLHVSGMRMEGMEPEGASMHELVSAGAILRSQVEGALRYSAYRALHEVSEDAWRLDAPERLRMAEDLARDYLHEALEILPAMIPDPRFTLEVTGSPPDVSMDETSGSRVLVRARLGGTVLRMSTRDGKTSTALPVDDISVELDSRYFLLQGLMDNFIERMGSVNTYWGMAEYLASWLEAWTTGRVNLNRTKTRALFEAAWCLHEFNTFGSADCAAPLISTLTEILGTSPPSSEPMGISDHVRSLGMWIEATRDMLSSHADRLEKIGGMLRRAGDNLTAYQEEILGELKGMKEDLLRARDTIPDLQKVGRSGGGSPDQILAGLNGLIEKLDNVIRMVVEAGRSGNHDIWLENAIRFLTDLAVTSGTVSCIELQDSLGERHTVPVFIRSVDDATLPRLRSVLEGMSRDIDRLNDFPICPDVSAFQELILMISGASPVPDREELFCIFPQRPLRDEPGVSVFHNMRIKEVGYRREDPAGLIGAEMATPVPLWFIGVTVWWGQWEVVLKLDCCEESICDFRNKVIPALTGLGGAHVPLRYGWRFGENEFRIRVIVASLRPFLITSG